MMKSDDILAAVMDVMGAFVPQNVAFDADSDLLDILDSAAMINVLLTLEERLNIRIDASDMTFDHFENCRVLSARLARKVLA